MENKKSKFLEIKHLDELEKEFFFKKFNLVVHKNERKENLLISELNEKLNNGHYFDIYNYYKYYNDLKYSNYFKSIIGLIDNKVKSISIGVLSDDVTNYLIAEYDCQDRVKYSFISPIYLCIELVCLLIESENKYLLISEKYFHGVYYKKYKDIFILIFKICNELNVQLIIDTCVNDVFNGFVDALLELDEKDSQVIRIDTKEEKISPVCFDLKELLIAKDNQISIF